MTVYAVSADVAARLSSAYSLPADVDTLLIKASELIDEMTLSRAQVAYDSESTVIPPDPTPLRDALRNATCDQVEFWLEVGEEHDVAGLRGSLVAGRVQVHPVAPILGPRAKRTLQNAGLYWSGVSIG